MTTTVTDDRLDGFLVPTALYDARLLAKAWLAVSLAAASGPEAHPALDRTVSIEHFDTGVRLTATDRIVLLRAWVPSILHDFAPEPGLDEVPEVTAVAIDWHGRGKGLFAHLLKLIEAQDKEDVPYDPIEVRLTIGAKGDDETDAPTLDLAGAGRTFAVIEHPGHELVKLACYGGEYPSWRPTVTRFRREETDALALNTEVLGRLAKVGKLFPTLPLVWRFGGAERMAAVEIANSYPWVRGVVMPTRWDFDTDQPYATAEILRTGSGVVVDGTADGDAS